MQLHLKYRNCCTMFSRTVTNMVVLVLGTNWVNIANESSSLTWTEYRENSHSRPCGIYPWENGKRMENIYQRMIQRDVINVEPGTGTQKCVIDEHASFEVANFMGLLCGKNWQ